MAKVSSLKERYNTLHEKLDKYKHMSHKLKSSAERANETLERQK